MTDRLYAVLNTRGPRWNHSLSMEEHEGWRTHADFMNALVAEGFIVLGGPLDGTRDVLLIVRAESEVEAERRPAPDVWIPNGFLERRWIAPWTLRLGALPALDARGADNHVDVAQAGRETRRCSRKNET
jgi:hypothetical protein